MVLKLRSTLTVVAAVIGLAGSVAGPLYAVLNA